MYIDYGWFFLNTAFIIARIVLEKTITDACNIVIVCIEPVDTTIAIIVIEAAINYKLLIIRLNCETLLKVW